MKSSQRKKENSKINSARKIESGSMDPQWGKEKDALQSMAEQNLRLHEEITKESCADSIIQVGIQDKISELKEQAVRVAKKLESEKRKNMELEAIIRHMKFVMEEQKKTSAAHRDDMNFQNMDNLSRKIKKSEYDLEQMYARSNELSSKIRIEKNQIDSSRTQRVIDSAIFVKIEKELVKLELDYKKLLIEKTKYQKEYNKKLQHYKKIKIDIQKQHSAINNSISRERPEQDNEKEEFFYGAPEIQHAVKFTEINTVNEPRKKPTQVRRISQMTELNKDQEKSQEAEFQVKKIFIETGLQNAPVLIDHLTNINSINEALYQEVNEKCDFITSLKEELAKIRQFKVSNAVKYYDKQPDLTKAQIQHKNSVQLINQIEDLSSCIKFEDSKLHNFMKVKKSKELKDFIKTDQASLSKNEEDGEEGLEEIEEFFAMLEKKIAPILSNYKDFKDRVAPEEPLSPRTALLKKTESSTNESLEQMIYRTKKMEQSEKIMVREQFKRQYENLKKNGKADRPQGKRKTTIIRHHH